MKQTAFITGASRGLGGAIALRVAIKTHVFHEVLDGLWATLHENPHRFGVA